MTGDVLFGRFELRMAERALLADGQPLSLGSRAYDVLLALVAHRDRVVSKAELLDQAWPGLVVEENNLTVQISALRKVLGPDAIATVPGRGYQFSRRVAGEAAQHQDGQQAPPRPHPDTRHSNLPALLPPLYGREGDLEELQQLVSRHRLVTIAGPGGIGKTRLAEAVAHAMRDSFANSAWMVELASLTDAALLVQTVAQALRIPLPSRTAPRADLLAALRDQRLLVVLDNCEHLLDAVSSLALDILREAPGVHLLATSQELLRLPQEQLHRIAPLAVPQLCHPSQAEDFGALRLFVERVRALDAGFMLTAATIGTVISICTRLDGIALAIELAAARVPMYGVAGIHDQLDNRFRVLTAGSRASDRRHQTLGAALDWSHGLLGEAEQKVFRRLSVFTGGFTLASAQSIASTGAGDAAAVLDQLSSLIDKSLVLVDKGVRPRYRMLETTRSYALDKLEQAGEKPILVERHARATVALLEQAVRRRDMELLVQEMNNVRAAYAWATGPGGDRQLAVAIATGSSVVLAVQGFAVEALDRLCSVESFVDASTPPPLAARYWQWIGRCGMDGRLPVPKAIAALRRAEQMFSEQGNTRHLHACLRMRAQALLETRDFDEARTALDEAQAMEDRESLPVADRMRRLRVQGLLEDQATAYPQALATYESACQLAEAAGIERYVLILLADIAGVHLKLGHAEESATRYRELARRARLRRGSGLTLCYALAGLTAALVSGADLVAARGVAGEAVPLLRRSGIFLARCDIFAWLLASEGKLAAAARLAGGADEFRRRSSSSRDAMEQHVRQRVEGLLLAGHPAHQVEAWLAAGRASHEEELAALLN